MNNLTPGCRYLFTAPVFPDLVVRMDGAVKVFADDPLAGEVRLYVVSGGQVIGDTDYLNGANFAFGRYTEHTLLFTATSTEVEINLECRGRWGLLNNGFFVDSLRLEAVGSPAPVPTPTPVPDDLVTRLSLVRENLAEAYAAMEAVYPEALDVFTKLERARIEALEVVDALR